MRGNGAVSIAICRETGCPAIADFDLFFVKIQIEILIRKIPELAFVAEIFDESLWVDE